MLAWPPEAAPMTSAPGRRPPLLKGTFHNKGCCQHLLNFAVHPLHQGNVTKCHISRVPSKSLWWGSAVSNFESSLMVPSRQATVQFGTHYTAPGHRGLCISWQGTSLGGTLIQLQPCFLFAGSAPEAQCMPKLLPLPVRAALQVGTQ